MFAKGGWTPELLSNFALVRSVSLIRHLSQESVSSFVFYSDVQAGVHGLHGFHVRIEHSFWLCLLAVQPVAGFWLC